VAILDVHMPGADGFDVTRQIRRREATTGTRLPIIAMTADTLDPAGIYFGTRSGKLYASRDEGTNWRQILDRVPAITCVKAAIV